MSLDNKYNNEYYFIKLYGANANNFEAKISLHKLPYIIEYKWYLGKNGYPFAYINGARVPLHKYIWYLNKGTWNNNIIDINNNIKKMYIDHINRDKLDATDENLRLSTPAENSYNKTSKNNIIDPISNKPLHHIKLRKSGYEVSITKNGNISKINNIKDLEEAKDIYNIMALELFGEYAVLYENIDKN